MKWPNVLFPGMIAWLALVASGNAQSDPSTVAEEAIPDSQVEIAAEPTVAPAPWSQDGDDQPNRFWVRGEYLRWWTRGLELPPLVTTSPPGTDLFNAGVLDFPGTTVLFGNSRVNDDARSGGRFSAGFWFDCAQSCGIEARYFFLDTETTTFSRESAGEPILARPFYQIERNQHNSLLIAYPDVVRGNVQVAASSELYGAEANFRHKLCGSCCYRVDVLAGYRFLNLRDDLRIRETEISTNDEFLPVGTRFELTDSFNTRNRFHGGQVGLDAEFRRGRWSLELLAKVALGVTNMEADIQGQTFALLPGEEPITSRGGLLALPSNIGQHHQSEFSVVPELGINIGYQVTNCARIGTGYTLIYWNNVTRPGDIIDLGINTTQVPPGDLVGEARPAFSFRDSSFWAQGLNFFLEIGF